MKLIKTKFKGLIIIKKDTFKDKRGYFRELYLQKNFDKNFPFDVMSYSKKNVLRGMHLQLKNPQAKYINVLQGKIFDVCLDCRKKSKTFGKYFSINLKNENTGIFIPKGFAHGFLTLKKNTKIMYLVSNYHSSKHENRIKFDNKLYKIRWPHKPLVISKKDFFC